MTAVDELSVTIASGRVTALLGPNGAGKSTVMRMVLGLDHPTSGTALIDGRPYGSLRHPLRTVGAHLDARAFHPRRTARANLLALARYSGIGRRRVEEVLAETGLAEVSSRRAGGFSLGMGQRLGIAAALLGDPQTLILDEPVNGLDADGVRWVRDLTRRWAAEGRTVLISSHLMSEIAVSADHVVVIGRGKLLADAPLEEMTARHDSYVEVEAADEAGCARLVAVVAARGVIRLGPRRLRVPGAVAALIGQQAHEAAVVLHELHTNRVSLEEAYMDLVRDDVEFRTVAPSRQQEVAV
ncbi:ATP-binding cassette domain-containing protein [Streptomyces sp. NPDC021224]|uniref:ATP-binding cassette domain-containing protein n=1 Tax=unclassified Streptomyces TaxID=2593676 RepID=UPI0037941AC6